MLSYVMVSEPNDSNTKVLNDAFFAAMSAENPRAAIQALLASLGKAYGTKRAYVYLLPPKGTEFLCANEWCAPGIEPMSDVTHGLTMDMASRWFGDGEPRSLLAIRKLDLVPSFNKDYASLFGPRGMKSQILGKLLRGNKPMGTLGFDDPDPNRFDELCKLMYPICAFATSTVNTQNLLDRMRTVGLVDELTRAGTRIGFYQKAENLPAHLPVGVAYLDVAGLQGFNNVRSHKSGDELLVGIRQILATEFQDDQVFRMSGDEFLVFAQGIPEILFKSAMERIKSKLDELSVYVALGMSWHSSIGDDYEAIVRQCWLACSNAKHEWERRGGKRLGDDTDDDKRLASPHTPSSSELFDTHLHLPCYEGEDFFNHLNVWLAHLETKRVGLAAFDINYFKLYNDIYGREAGDMLLETYAKALQRLATISHGVAGYLGGDNFCIAFPVDDTLEPTRLVEKVEVQISKHAVAEGFSPAIGLVLTNNFDLGTNVLYDRALVALNRVKGDYTNHVALYDEQRRERDRENQLLLIEAQNALSNGEFTFYLQPKVDINSNKVVSAEALVRWFHEGKIISPAQFVGLMEKSGHIFALDRHIWESVCAWQRSIINRGLKPVPVSVNVSRVDFYFDDLATHFVNLVKRYGIEPRLLGIEITESAYSEDENLIEGVITKLRDAGFRVLMDDFGTGYSSLNMLRSVTIDALKMDKGFIDHANIQDGSDAIIESVIRMAHRLGIPVISEGVETEEQCDSLRVMACDYVQGYYFYRPMPIAEFERLLTTDSKDQP